MPIESFKLDSFSSTSLIALYIFSFSVLLMIYLAVKNLAVMVLLIHG
jgi:hypothetical protein